MDGLCSSPCNFFTPFFAEYRLYKTINGAQQFVANWFEGEILDPAWQGILEGASNSFEMKNYTESVMAPGSKFQLQVLFSDPKYSFDMYKQQTLQKLKGYMDIGTLPTISDGSFSGGGTIGTLPTIGTIITDDSINTGSMDSGNGDDIANNNSSAPTTTLDERIKAEVNKIRRLIQFENWPPYYEAICDTGLVNCTDNLSSFAAYTVDFEVGKLVSDASNGPGFPGRPGMPGMDDIFGSMGPKNFEIKNVTVNYNAFGGSNHSQTHETGDLLKYKCDF